MGAASNKRQQDSEPSVAPFAGCTRLLDHYRQVGASLLAFEDRVCGTFGSSKAHVRSFAVEVSFVPVEVLEAFLDDVLDLGVSDESLFIKKSKPATRAVALLGICFGATALVASRGPSEALASCLPLLLLVVFLAGLGSAMYFIPRAKVFRRFNFATVLSREISNRRGSDRNDMGGLASRLFSSEWWASKGTLPTPYGSMNRDLVTAPVVSKLIH
jgi:hypothetical protein